MMTKTPHHPEQVITLDAAKSVVATACNFGETARVDGHYKLHCQGPRDQDIADYAYLRDAMWAAEKAGNVVQAAQLMAKLQGIPIETKWQDTIDNLVTTVGKNNMLDNHLSGSAYTATWYMGLISSVSYTTGPAVGDTMASHGGWTEDVSYSNAARPTTAWSAASAGVKALSAGLVFNINASATLKGCFLNSISTKSGTTGTLFSAGLFTGGDQPVVNTNTLTVSYSCTQS